MMWLFIVLYTQVFIVQSQQATNATTVSKTKDSFNADNLIYNTSLSSWQEAVTACHRHSNGSLLHIPDVTSHDYINETRNKFHPDSTWIGNYRVFGSTFEPDIGAELNSTTKCVALTITSIVKDGGVVNVKYQLNIQYSCSDRLAAMCRCHSGFSNTLSVRSVQHGWSYYQANQCGRNCALWDPPHENVTPGDFETLVGKGNVTLGGLGSNLLVGMKYWVNVLVTVIEGPINGSSGIIECGYIVPFSNDIVYGRCDVEKTFICQSPHGYRRQTTVSSRVTPRSLHNITVSSTIQNYGESGSSASVNDGLSTVAYVGIIGGSVVFIVLCISVIVAISVSTRCCKRRDIPSDFKAKGGRSFVKHTETTDQPEQNINNSDEKRHTLYAQIDPNRVRRDITPAARNGAKQPDIVLTTTTSTGYLPMDGFKNTISNDTYDAIEMDVTSSDDGGNYVEVDDHVGLYSVSSVVDDESEYDTTFDRHPSQRMLITPNTYDKANFTRTPSMEDPVCNSVNMENGYYSTLQQKNVKNPNYDRIVIK